MKERPKLPGNAGHHAVQFYREDHRLCLSIADFLADGLAAGQPTIIIATPDHRTGILDELRSRRFDVDALQAAGAVLVLDAQDTLDRIMTSGAVDAGRFRDVIGAAIIRVVSATGEVVVRAFGEMVDVLWRSGNHDAAIRLETLWNELARTHPLSLMCGYYAIGGFPQAAARDEVCALHTHVYLAA